MSIKITEERANEILNSVCDLLDRNDNLTMQVDYFDYENMSEIEFVREIINAMIENDENGAAASAWAGAAASAWADADAVWAADAARAAASAWAGAAASAWADAAARAHVRKLFGLMEVERG